MFNQATPLLDKIKSPKLLIQLAKVYFYIFNYFNISYIGKRE